MRKLVTTCCITLVKCYIHISLYVSVILQLVQTELLLNTFYFGSLVHWFPAWRPEPSNGSQDKSEGIMT